MFAVKMIRTAGIFLAVSQVVQSSSDDKANNRYNGAKQRLEFQNFDSGKTVAPTATAKQRLEFQNFDSGKTVAPTATAKQRLEFQNFDSGKTVAPTATAKQRLEFQNFDSGKTVAPTAKPSGLEDGMSYPMPPNTGNAMGFPHPVGQNNYPSPENKDIDVKQPVPGHTTVCPKTWRSLNDIKPGMYMYNAHSNAAYSDNEPPVSQTGDVIPERGQAGSVSEQPDPEETSVASSNSEGPAPPRPCQKYRVSHHQSCYDPKATAEQVAAAEKASRINTDEEAQKHAETPCCRWWCW